MSCRGPANHNSVALVLPHKSMVSFLGGAIGADIHNDRSGIHCRSVTDSAKVLDALPRWSEWLRTIRATPLRQCRAPASADRRLCRGRQTRMASQGSLKGLRIGDHPRVDAHLPWHQGGRADHQPRPQRKSRRFSGGHLGATLVESTDPLWPDDPQIENMPDELYTRTRRTRADLLPGAALIVSTGAGQPIFPEFAAAIQAHRICTPARTFGSGTMKPVDYMLGMAEGGDFHRPALLNIRTIQTLADERLFRYPRGPGPPSRRAADWAARGLRRKRWSDWQALNARSKFWSDEQRAWWKNWEEVVERARAGWRTCSPSAERVQLRELLRRVEMKVIQENRLDVVVRLHTSLPPGRIGLAPQPGPAGGVTRGDLRMGPYAGETEVLIPAGYVRERLRCRRSC